MRNPVDILKKRDGVAILVAIFAIMLMVFVATEVSYDTTVEFVVARQQVNRLKAYYAARSGVEIGLLRVHVFKKVVATVSELLGGLDKVQAQMPLLDQIWQMPFSWPISPDLLSGAERGQLEDINKESIFDGKYLITISSEGGKIDINDLGSASKNLQTAIKNQLLKIFKDQIENNDDFREKYANFRFEEMVNNMIDWVDEDQTSLNGGDERDKYEIRSDFVPPNAPFKTVQEINMVAGMNEDFYNLLKDRITIFGTKGVNLNYAPREVIEALDPSMKGEPTTKALSRRSNPTEGGPFANAEDFLNFVQQFGADSNAIRKSGIPLICGPEYNFRVIGDGLVSNVKRTITAITFDIENLRSRYGEMLDKEALGNTTISGANTVAAPKIVPPKARPTVVYWEEI